MKRVISTLIIPVALILSLGMKGCKSLDTGTRLPVKTETTWYLEEPNQWVHIGQQLGPNWVQIGWTYKGRPVWLRRHHQ